MRADKQAEATDLAVNREPRSSRETSPGHNNNPLPLPEKLRQRGSDNVNAHTSPARRASHGSVVRAPHPAHYRVPGPLHDRVMLFGSLPNLELTVCCDCAAKFEVWFNLSIRRSGYTLLSQSGLSRFPTLAFSLLRNQ